MKRPIFVLMSVVVLLAMALSACAPAAAAPTTSTLIKVRVATDATYPPFESVNDQTKQLEGFDIDLMNAIAQKAGFDVTYTNINFDALLAGMATSAQNSLLEGCPIFVERLRNSQELAAAIKKLMQTFGKQDSLDNPK